MYLCWFDDSKKIPAQKIVDAIAAYEQRFGCAPTVILTNEAERVDVPGVEVRSEGYVRRNNFWVGLIAAPGRA